MISWREKCLEYPSIMFGRAIRSARTRASKKGIPFDITKGYVLSLFEDQNGKCFYSGIKLNIVKEDERMTHDPFKMSLDCVDPSLGYVEGNVVWSAYCVNALKQKMPTEKMVDVCREIVKNADKKEYNR